MAFNITIGFQDDTLNNESKEAFARTLGYQPNLPDPNNPEATIPNPETKAQFRDRMIKRYVKDTIKAYRIAVIQESLRTMAEVND